MRQIATRWFLVQAIGRLHFATITVPPVREMNVSSHYVQSTNTEKIIQSSAKIIYRLTVRSETIQLNIIERFQAINERTCTCCCCFDELTITVSLEFPLFYHHSHAVGALATQNQFVKSLSINQSPRFGHNWSQFSATQYSISQSFCPFILLLLVLLRTPK